MSVNDVRYIEGVDKSKYLWEKNKIKVSDITKEDPSFSFHPSSSRGLFSLIGKKNCIQWRRNSYDGVINVFFKYSN